MEKNYKLYVHIAPNGKRYYGITKQNIIKRWNHGHGYKGNEYFTRAINKYGWDNIKHEVLFDGLTESEAQELEKYMIQWYDTANRKYGYNISLGGESANGFHHTEETKQKISKTLSGRQLAEETKQKMSEARMGKNHPKAKSVICLTTKYIFPTTTEASNYYNIHKSHISGCCKGRLKSAGKLNEQKLVWRYLNYKHNKTYRKIETAINK